MIMLSTFYHAVMSNKTRRQNVTETEGVVCSLLIVYIQRSHFGRKKPPKRMTNFLGADPGF